MLRSSVCRVTLTADLAEAFVWVEGLPIRHRRHWSCPAWDGCVVGYAVVVADSGLGGSEGMPATEDGPES